MPLLLLAEDFLSFYVPQFHFVIDADADAAFAYVVVIVIDETNVFSQRKN